MRTTAAGTAGRGALGCAPRRWLGARAALIALALAVAACSESADPARDSDGAGQATGPTAGSTDTPGPPDGRHDGVAGASPSPTAATATPGDDGSGTGTGATPAPQRTLSPTAWTELARAPTALTEVGATGFGGRVWTAGGFDTDGQAVTTVQVYDPTFDVWVSGPPLPEAVHHAALVADGASLYLVGGYTGPSFREPTGAVRVLEADTGQWADAPALPAPRAAGAAVWDGQRLVYAGGVGPDGLAGEVFALAPGAAAWQAIGTLATPREHLAGASDGAGRAWFLAGRTGGLDTNQASVEIVEGASVRVVGDLPTARGGVAGFYAPGAGGCAVGGEGPAGTFAEVECIDADGAVTTLPGLGQARHGLGAAVVEGVAYAVLGGPEPGLFVSDATEALPLEPAA